MDHFKCYDKNEFYDLMSILFIGDYCKIEFITQNTLKIENNKLKITSAQSY